MSDPTHGLQGIDKLRLDLLTVSRDIKQLSTVVRTAHRYLDQWAAEHVPRSYSPDTRAFTSSTPNRNLVEKIDQARDQLSAAYETLLRGGSRSELDQALITLRSLQKTLQTKPKPVESPSSSPSLHPSEALPPGFSDDESSEEGTSVTDSTFSIIDHEEAHEPDQKTTHLQGLTQFNTAISNIVNHLSIKRGKQPPINSLSSYLSPLLIAIEPLVQMAQKLTISSTESPTRKDLLQAVRNATTALYNFLEAPDIQNDQNLVEWINEATDAAILIDEQSDISWPEVSGEKPESPSPSYNPSIEALTPDVLALSDTLLSDLDDLVLTLELSSELSSNQEVSSEEKFLRENYISHLHQLLNSLLPESFYSPHQEREDRQSEYESVIHSIREKIAQTKLPSSDLDVDQLDHCEETFAAALAALEDRDSLTIETLTEALTDIRNALEDLRSAVPEANAGQLWPASLAAAVSQIDSLMDEIELKNEISEDLVQKIEEALPKAANFLADDASGFPWSSILKVRTLEEVIAPNLAEDVGASTEKLQLITSIIKRLIEKIQQSSSYDDKSFLSLKNNLNDLLDTLHDLPENEKNIEKLNSLKSQIQLIQDLLETSLSLQEPQISRLIDRISSLKAHVENDTLPLLSADITSLEPQALVDFFINAPVGNAALEVLAMDCAETLEWPKKLLIAQQITDHLYTLTVLPTRDQANTLWEAIKSSPIDDQTIKNSLSPQLYRWLGDGSISSENLLAIANVLSSITLENKAIQELCSKIIESAQARQSEIQRLLSSIPIIFSQNEAFSEKQHRQLAPLMFQLGCIQAAAHGTESLGSYLANASAKDLFSFLSHLQGRLLTDTATKLTNFLPWSVKLPLVDAMIHHIGTNPTSSVEKDSFTEVVLALLSPPEDLDVFTTKVQELRAAIQQSPPKEKTS